MKTLDCELHAHFQRTARRVSGRLARAIGEVGPIGFPRRRTRNLGLYLARVVVGQQLSTHAARAIWTRIEAAAGAHRSALPDFFVPPHGPALRACGLSGRKVQTLLELRHAVAEGQLRVPMLARLDHAARTGHLMRISGIGPWTADMVSMFFFHEPDVWPIGDVTVRNTFARFAAVPAAADLGAAAARFAPHRSFLALYMWRLADTAPA